MTSRYFGLIAAAGTGSRFGGAAPKQYHALAGRPMLHHAVRGLLAAGEIETVFVVLAPDDGLFRGYDWSEFGDRLAPLYCGGSSRHDSVLNGLVAASSVVDPEDWVLVHDAARPCLGKVELRRLIDTVAREGTGGILAVPVADTLKRADAQGDVVETVDRTGLWAVQTPQLFRADVLRAAYSRPDIAAATDDAALLERAGRRVVVVSSTPGNVKITTPGDLPLAGAVLSWEVEADV